LYALALCKSRPRLTRTDTAEQPSLDPNLSVSFQDALKSIGPVNPGFQVSSSLSKFQDPKTSQSVRLLQARSQIAKEAEKELYGEAGPGRQFLDSVTLRQLLVMRDRQGLSEEDIERDMGLKRGVVQRLGTPGVIEAT
jgi:hypothetical protein